jgi:hypothetical protein
MGNVTKYDKTKTVSLFVPCNCRNEILYIEYDHKDKVADFAIYTHGVYTNKLSLWQKIRYIWQVLVHSKPYADQLIFDNKQLQELKEFLISIDLK